MSDGAKKFFGKYRGTVVQNIDPMMIGRVMVSVPDVLGPIPTSWAMPCVPLAGKLEGTFMVPQIGAGVWVEFEQGDPDYPIWVGGFWGLPAELPAASLIPPAIPPGQNIVIQTTLQHLLAISDAPPLPMMAPIPAPAPPGTGGIVLRSPTGAMIVVNDTGIYINNGKGASIEMVGPSVMVNKVALVIT
ncbi:MAG TPA: phage baseplate assembly protein V [Pyrinomonadaceae bacterium]|nr:phage baseplate assembly protein V [Pyrinomonadaceae bacterium]